MDVQAVAGVSSLTPQSTPASPAPQQQGGGSAPGTQSTAHAEPGVLSSIVSRMYAKDGLPAADAPNVSYRVEHDPDMIVTVFTDPQTGQELAQIPAEVMVQFAQFFDKESGVTLDRNA